MGHGVAGAAATTLLGGGKARAARVGPNEQVGIAVIGNGGMGTRHIEALAVNDQCRLVAVCDVAKSRYMNAIDKVKELSDQQPSGYQDFRRVLDRPDVDAVFVVTPDHWHPLLTILACQAGKDVYVEKPVCTTIEEGRAMVNAARRYGRVVQAGTQQRSMPVFQKAVELVHSGRLGRVMTASAWVGVNDWGVGETPQDPPEGLDWDLWLGPAPWAPYSPERFGGFMGWHDYARGGQLTNWGVHLMDIVHWGIRADRPLSVQALGGSYRRAPGADNYETIEALFEYPGCNVTWEQRHQNTHGDKGYGISFHGTDGVLFVDRGTFKVRPADLGIEEYVGEPEKSWANPPHHNNFFECVRTRGTPAADIEQGFRSTAAVLLAGIALKVRRRLEWDGKAERFLNDEQANRHLARAYRAPWHL
ncbi:MAG TPA: Gfo/Idh/MocA family oxidoreductase [Candidatus Hydrogenedentes bacterium]|nr:Gfo/Idh/MocA family oxidoreductase [Candidatus Hydrogenedentota bacterium]HNT89121.1 Gfo/Idh/MocA family oxidoreductase [Candidatus Hydrogenedentota bacterium]